RDHDAAAARTGNSYFRAAPYRRGFIGTETFRAGAAAGNRRAQKRSFDRAGSQGIARSGTGSSDLYGGIGEASVRLARTRPGGRTEVNGRAGGLRGCGSTVRKARRRVFARRARVCGRGELATSRAWFGLPTSGDGRSGHLPGASRIKRPRRASTSRAGDRTGDRDRGTPQRFPAANERISRPGG